MELFRTMYNSQPFDGILGLYSQIVSYWVILGVLVGPIYRFPYGLLQPDKRLGPMCPHTDFGAIRRGSRIGPSFLIGQASETLLALQAI